VAGGEGVMDVAEGDGQPLDAIRSQMPRLAGGIAVQGASHPVHQQHGAAVRVEVDQLGDEVGVRAIRLHRQGDTHLTGNG
jgi:hypothetical protein